MTWARRDLLGAVAGWGTGLAGCVGRGTSDPGADSAATVTDTGPEPTPATAPAGAAFAYTHLRVTGNRVLDGPTDVDEATPVDVTVDSTPKWLLAFDGDPGSLWTVVTADGTATTHRIPPGARDAEIVTDHGPVPTPPLGYVPDGTVGMVGGGSEYTHPVRVEGGWLSVTDEGDVAIRRDGGTTRLDVRAPTDAQVVAVGDERYALYGRRTDRYRHGALGDTVEGSSLVVVDAANELIETETRLDRPLVFEGLSPLVADADGDGEVEIVTTVADSADGARIRIYGTEGTSLATGPVYGSGWRHQLCVAPFAPDGTPELAVVRKPHVDHTLEFYRFRSDGSDDGLRVVATHEGYASHTYGSRNLDGGLAGDLDGDGRTELLVPRTDRSTLDAVVRTDGDAETAWSLSLPGSLSTNLTGVAFDDGRGAVGAGTVEGVRVWQL